MPFENPEQKRAYDHKYYQEHHYNVLGETDSHFHVQHTDGSTFKIAKKGLAPKTLDRIGKLPRMSVKGLDPMSIVPHLAGGWPAGGRRGPTGP